MNTRRITTEAQIRATESGAGPERKITFIISTDHKDRHNTVLNMDGWQLDNYRKNPIVLYSHQIAGKAFFTPPNPDVIIGKAKNIHVEKILDKKALVADVFFEPERINPLAEKIYQKILFGSLGAVSVGFMETGQGKYGTGDEARGMENETYYFAGQELLEFSVVDLPSNAFAGKREITPAGVQYAARALEMDPVEIKGMEAEKIMEMIEEKKSPPMTPQEREQARSAAQTRINNLKFNTMKRPQNLIDVIQAALSPDYRWEDYEINRTAVAQMERAGLTHRPDRNQIFIPLVTRATVEGDTMSSSLPYIPGLDLANTTVLGKAGVRFLTDQKANLTVPALSGIHSDFSDVYDPDTESASLESISFSPKRLSAFLAYSIDARLALTVEGGNYLKNALSDAAGAALEAAVLGASARSTERPQGMAYVASDRAAEAASLNNLQLLEDGVFENGHYQGQYSYLTSMKGFRNVINAISSSGTYPYLPFSWTGAHPNKDVFGFINGFPLFVSNNVTEAAGSGANGKALFFGNWSRMMVALFGSAILTIDPFTSAKYGITKMYLDLWVDVKGLDGVEDVGLAQDYDYKGFGCLPIT
mgnify:CR=1 FL=1